MGREVLVREQLRLERTEERFAHRVAGRLHPLGFGVDFGGCL